MDLTLLTPTPRPLCTPQQSIHKVIPKLIEAHSGFERPQSQQSSFPEKKIVT